MATPSKRIVVPLLRRSPAFRFLSMVVLVMSLGIEVLSCTFVECVAIAPAEREGRTCRLEPLELCDDPGSFGVLFDVPVVLPGVLCLAESPIARRCLQSAVAFVPDEFHGAIDHPPQISS
jgi:hypothetical protein